MKRALTLFCCLAISLTCLFAASCGAEGKSNMFVFLSVRMKGNGDGTLTCVAQNEFSIGSFDLPVTLTLYLSEEYQTDVAKMTAADSSSCGDLNFLQTVRLDYEIQSQGYFCAQATYSVNGETQTIQSDTVRYDMQGKRISSEE